jgi:hypothetical protein
VDFRNWSVSAPPCREINAHFGLDLCHSNNFVNVLSLMGGQSIEVAEGDRPRGVNVGIFEGALIFERTRFILIVCGNESRSLITPSLISPPTPFEFPFKFAMKLAIRKADLFAFFWCTSFNLHE